MPEPVEGALTHRVVQPRQACADAPPTLLLLHGRGSDEVDLLGLASELDPRLFVVSARAPFELGFGYHWYELVEVGRPEPRTFAEGFRRLDQFTRDLAELYGTDPQQLYLLGFSQGAMMAGTLTLRAPERVAGTIMLSGYLPLSAGMEYDESGLAGRPFFVAHGAQDPVIPVEFGREAAEYLRKVDADLEYREYSMAHQVEYDELRDVSQWLTGRLDSPTSGRQTGGRTG